MLPVRPVRTALRALRGFCTLSRLFQSAVTAKSGEKAPQVRSTNPSFPVNVEAIYHAPLRHKPKHKVLAAEVYFSSYGTQNMDFFVDFALRAAYYLGIPITGPMPLPIKRELYTVIRAPFVHAKTKENFERKTHKRMIRAWDANPEILDVWFSVLNKHSMAGVGIKTNVFVQESMSALKELDDVSFKVEELPYLNSDMETSDVVKQRVGALLEDPVFKKHMEPKKQQVESK